MSKLSTYPIAIRFENGNDIVAHVVATEGAKALASYNARLRENDTYKPYQFAMAPVALDSLSSEASVLVAGEGEFMTVEAITTAAWEACEVFLRYDESQFEMRAEELEGNPFRSDQLHEVAALLGETVESLTEEVKANGTLL